MKLLTRGSSSQPADRWIQTAD